MSSHADTIRDQIERGSRLTEQQRAWLLKMPSWTAVRGEDIMRHIDRLVGENVNLRAENEQLRDALTEIERMSRPIVWHAAKTAGEIRYAEVKSASEIARAALAAVRMEERP